MLAPIDEGVALAGVSKRCMAFTKVRTACSRSAVNTYCRQHEPKAGKKKVPTLPIELWYVIYCLLGFDDLVRACRVNKACLAIGASRQLWGPYLVEKGMPPPILGMHSLADWGRHFVRTTVEGGSPYVRESISTYAAMVSFVASAHEDYVAFYRSFLIVIPTMTVKFLKSVTSSCFGVSLADPFAERAFKLLAKKGVMTVEPKSGKVGVGPSLRAMLSALRLSQGLRDTLYVAFSRPV